MGIAIIHDGWAPSVWYECNSPEGCVLEPCVYNDPNCVEEKIPYGVTGDKPSAWTRNALDYFVLITIIYEWDNILLWLKRSRSKAT